MTAYMHFMTTYISIDIQKNTFGCFKIRIARAGTVSPRDRRGVEVQLYFRINDLQIIL